MTAQRYAIECSSMMDRHATGVGRYIKRLIEELSQLSVEQQAQTPFEVTQLYRLSRRRWRDKLAGGSLFVNDQFVTLVRRPARVKPSRLCRRRGAVATRRR